MYMYVTVDESLLIFTKIFTNIIKPKLKITFEIFYSIFKGLENYI